MKLLFISGPSGSGKTTLSNKITEKIKNGVVLSTDNYYKTGLISKLLSKFIKGYFDKSISFNQKLFRKDFNFILKNQISINQRFYDFDKQKTKNYLKQISNVNYLIVEGIFAKEFSATLDSNNFYFLELRINKKECMRRAVLRDLKERGKVKKQAEYDFLNSWDIYYKKYKKLRLKNKANKFIIRKMNNIDKILNKIFN